ncbi:sigma-E processing peptidase SpoIIGA [Fervidibacillus halotolerans]|uniref:Sporulation sigma-E factor-processing peptidase n=1 Tax=Fervidibacillus halotolerans TaxID=2980027 RepID=A0A9E8M3D9_9BACI|nr:sigma-E processing peptidase SpoIIGA [Fervidibacillus halotolerans]WAA13674.1 sigma-E processing peptidase SpoIIGA [Fervidibacillus halotolerans]
MPVYLDLIWLLNFLFNSLLLLITGILLKRKIRKKLIFFSGFIGSLLVFAPFLPLPSFFLTPWFKIGISTVMVWIAFGFKRFPFFFENLMMFYLCTFTAGGTLIGTHYLLNFHFDIGDERFLTAIYGFGDPISWLFIIIGFPLALYFSKGVFNRFETLKIKTDQLVDVRIDINGKTVDLIGLVDTGNLLYDPISKKPVMIVSLEKTDHLFPPDLLPVFDDANFLAKQKGSLDEWMQKLTVIPFQAVGGKDRLIVAVKPNKVRIQKDGKTIETDRLYLAFVKQRLSSEDLFDCIVHPKLLAEKNKRVS